jgi:SAM-dependent methyltransferase
MRFQPQRASSKVRINTVGGGLGGWVKYVAERAPDKFSKLALADSALAALKMAKTVLPGTVDRYQIDLMHLGWEDEWDIVFLLDVIEHLADDCEAIQQVARALKPGGHLFVTTPALDRFWSYNDEFANHLRRYSKRDFTRLADAAGLHLCEARYFMFLLSPLYWLIRRRFIVLTEAEKREFAIRNHRVPPYLINEFLAGVFYLETPLGHKLSFPWGTSILAILQKH